MMSNSPSRLSMSTVAAAGFIGLAAALIIFGSSATRSQAQCWTWATWTCQGRSACGTTACSTMTCNPGPNYTWICSSAGENIWIDPNATANGVQAATTGSMGYNNSGGGSTNCTEGRACSSVCVLEDDGYEYCQSDPNGALDGGFCGMWNMALTGGNCPSS